MVGYKFWFVEFFVSSFLIADKSFNQGYEINILMKMYRVISFMLKSVIILVLQKKCNSTSRILSNEHEITFSRFHVLNFLNKLPKSWLFHITMLKTYVTIKCLWQKEKRKNCSCTMLRQKFNQFTKSKSHVALTFFWELLSKIRYSVFLLG